jgi:hypothetical protein
MEIDNQQCPLCKQGATSHSLTHGGEPAFEVHCQRCGGFIITKTAWLQREAGEELHLVSGYVREMTERGTLSVVTDKNMEELKDFAPRGVVETSQRFFRTLCGKSHYPGEEVALDLKTDYTLAYCRNWSEWNVASQSRKALRGNRIDGEASLG